MVRQVLGSAATSSATTSAAADGSRDSSWRAAVLRAASSDASSITRTRCGATDGSAGRSRPASMASTSAPAATSRSPPAGSSVCGSQRHHSDSLPPARRRRQTGHEQIGGPVGGDELQHEAAQPAPAPRTAARRCRRAPRSEIDCDRHVGKQARRLDERPGLTDQRLVSPPPSVPPAQRRGEEPARTGGTICSPLTDDGGVRAGVAARVGPTERGCGSPPLARHRRARTT